MQNTGKFLAKVTVFGGAMDSDGTIISRDTHGLPPVWLNVIAGSIPNRQTLTGSVALRAGIIMDGDGVIGARESKGHPFAFRIVLCQWLQTGVDERYGPQFSWTVLQDLTTASIKDQIEAEALLGKPEVFTVSRPELPEDYQKKTNQHIGRNKLDPAFHGTANQTHSNPVEKATADLGNFRSDTKGNPEVEVRGNQSTEKIKNEIE